ncbi:MAG: hypothetical protein JW969_04655 [Spirochaetales bacterium]|nr:hypothetical protein [Spirochaetales bacterium]
MSTKSIKHLLGIFLLFLIPVSNLFPDSNQEWEKLMAGEIFVEIIDQNQASGTRLRFKVDASAERVWKVLTDNTILTDLHPDVDKVEALVDEPGKSVIRYWVTILFTTYDYALDSRYDAKNFRITWTKTEGDFKQITGFWRIYPLPEPDTCLVINESFVETGFAVPRWLEDWIKANKTRDLANDIRKWIKKHP